MQGTASKDGKPFTNNAGNKKYKVSNPDALSGHEGQQVSLILRLIRARTRSTSFRLVEKFPGLEQTLEPI
jgi:hypothetical protein